MKKIRTAMTIAIASACLLSGCEGEQSTVSTNNAEIVVVDIATQEIRQNDYRGGVMRTYALQNNVLTIMEGMKRNNTVIREDNPNSYWTTNGYQDFVSTFLTAPIINDTQWFNEEETDWNTLVSQMFSVWNSFTVLGDDGTYQAQSGIYAVRNEKDDYSIYGTKDYVGSDSGNSTYRILYDCDKDWCKAYTDVAVSGSGVSNITSQMFEYARINNNVFAIQTATERLLVVLEDAADADIRERPIKEFYYSKLSGGQRTTFTPYEPLPEEDEVGRKITENVQTNKLRAKYPLLNEYGEVATQYGVKNSIFLQDDVSATSYPWVFEDGALQQAIVYKEGTLVVTTFNKLSEKYERFIYSIEKVKPELIAEIEAMVNIEGLVGVVDVSTSTDVGNVPADTSNNEAVSNSNSTEDIATNETKTPAAPSSENSSSTDSKPNDDITTDASTAVSAPPLTNPTDMQPTSTAQTTAATTPTSPAAPQETPVETSSAPEIEGGTG